MKTLTTLFIAGCIINLFAPIFIALCYPQYFMAEMFLVMAFCLICLFAITLAQIYLSMRFGPKS